MRLKKIDDEKEMMELLKDIGMKKERELKERIEKDMIRKELADLDKVKMNALDLEKRKELLKLL